ncbi:MAG: DUF3108 domain-containing protein, partial [Candidatus Omnitrophica bacterium]|nr:DUF3108 domain-containing protein [Candidatus Omnitrophota bacterium]
MTKFNPLIFRVIIFTFLSVLTFRQSYLLAKEDPIETINYAVKKAIKLGDAKLEFFGEEKVEGENCYLIVFTATGFKFYDREQIYVSSKDYYPVLVKRDLNIAGTKELIEERYSRKDNQVEITNTDSKGKVKKTTLSSKKRMENIYGFIYRYRVQGEFKIGEEITVNLPTKEVKIKLEEKKKISVAGKEYNAYFMSGRAHNIRIWFDDGPKKIPLRIDGSLGIGSTAMV